MQPRINFYKVSTGGYQAMLHLENYARGAVDHTLLHLVKLRASQINKCAFCIDMHWKDARADGESEQRLYGLDAWEESPYYTDKERAALAWTEAVTLVSETNVPDSVYGHVREHFSEEELVNLTWAIAAINSWNRMCVSLRSVPGTYQPAKKH